MGRLRVRLRGKPVYDFNLKEERSYVVGRKEDCDIVLQPEKGISREHFKISFASGTWVVEVVSRYGEVLFEGQKVQEFNLQSGSHFYVPPYEFEFSQSADSSPAEVANDTSNLPVPSEGLSADNFNGSDEKTRVGLAPLAAFVKILDDQNEAKEIFRLDAGDAWTAGRDASCHIQIRDQRVSRQQFEIRRQGLNYVIMDLGSVNGTFLNGNPLTTEPSILKSGDAISVLSNYLYFELHDLNYEKKLELVKANPPAVPLFPTGVEASPVSFQPTPSYDMVSYQQQQAVVPYQQPLPISFPPQGPKKFDFEKNRPLVFILAGVVLIGAYFLSEGKDHSEPKQPAQVFAPGSPQEAFTKLQPEQQALVRQRYKDAKNLYMQGKYQLAQEEVLKIQALVPDYEDIKDIERLSKEAIYLQEQQRQNEEKEKQALEIELKIQKQVEVCVNKLDPEITRTVMDDCLSSVMEFNPTHPKIVDLQNQVDAILAQKEAKAAAKAAYQGQVSQLRSIYAKAQEVQRVGKPLDAIAAFEKVLKSSLPDPNGLKTESQRNIASIKQMMSSKTSSLQAEAEKLYQSQDIKGAILTLRKARVIDPENTEIPDKIDSYTSELRKTMMRIYQEGILEESFGNVENDAKTGAKDKWRKILEKDIPDGEYYKKAIIKLKKYGAL
jgi:pSer/pThr/pTyr-binding forkhead associated (FHA) protein